MSTKEIDLLEVLKYLREIRDEATQSLKVLELFSDGKNWDWRYTDKKGRIEKFDFLEFDPRIIADKGKRAAQKIIEDSDRLWYMLYDPIRSPGEVDSILLKEKKDCTCSYDDSEEMTNHARLCPKSF